MENIENMKYLFTLLFSLILNFIYAQNGAVVGKIVDNDNGFPLPGANIILKDTDYGTISDVSGNFILPNVVPNDYTLIVSYIGYNDIEKEISVSTSFNTEIDIELESGVLVGDEIIILGNNLQGQARAINEQRNNVNITNIISSDQTGKFPDSNMGDALKRIPGITMQGDQGEARNIVVRGLASALNSVMIDGSRIPSAEGDNRNVQLDLIPADMIQTIEVNKATLPYMDGDAVGGVVNLVTRSAPDGLRFSADLGSGFSPITSKPIYNGSFVFGDRLGNFGFLLSGSYNNRDYGSDNIEAEWKEGEGGNWIPDEMDIRTYYVKRERKSISLNLDYEFSSSSKIYLNSLYNHRDDWENRFRLRYKKITDGFEDGYTPLGNGRFKTTARIERQTKGGIDDDRNQGTRLEDQKATNVTLGGNHLAASKLKIDWMVNFSRASEKRPNERYLTFRNNDVPIILDISDPSRPFIDYEDANAWQGSKARNPEEAQKWTYENELNAKVDFTLPITDDGILKFGLKNRSKTKLRNNIWSEYDGTLVGSTLSEFPLIDQSDSDYLAGSKYLAGNFVTTEYLGGLNLNGSSFDSELVLDEFAAGNYDADENIFAAYAMVDLNLTQNLSLIAGGRFEATSIEYTGRDVDYENESVSITAPQSDSYSNFLPAILFKYDPTENTAFRLSYTNSIARPNYYDLVPYQEYIEEDDELNVGNPLLKPMKAVNLDLNYESYFSTVGLFSAGVFYKDLKDFIYSYQYDGTYSGYTGELEITQPTNGASATVFGFEVAFQRQILKNLGLYVNYTFADTDTEGVLDRSDLDKIPLPGAAKNTYNLSLDYETEKFNIRVSYNFTDSYIDEFGGDPMEDRYYDSQAFLDVNASYSFTDNLRFYLQFKNLTNQPLRYYQGTEEYLMQEEFYGSRYTAGLKFDLFK